MLNQRTSSVSFFRAYWPAILWGMFILYATLTPGKSLPSVSLFRFDKLIHLMIFGTFAWLVLRGLRLRSVATDGKIKTMLYSLIGLCSILFGIGIEWLQNFIPDRSADIYDVIANTTGIILAQIVFYLLYRNKSLV